ncbi:MAG TPA: hypothetical protein VMX94_01335 [Armatimonadota bacterium]|nr:hypothetical protein [Armatimonadota bacterium]
MRTYQPLVIVVAVTSVLLFGAAVSAGTFRDRDGAAHEWSINESHALTWEGAPYVPFGVVFEPKYLASGQTDENWAADEESAAAFKLAGVMDVVIRPGKAITSVPVEAFQRIIDLLETSGLRYGIELFDPPYAPISGYVIQPAINRVEGIQSSGPVTRSFTDTKTAVYAIRDGKAEDAKVTSVGREIAVNGEVTVPVVVQAASDHVVLFYPEKVVADGNPDWGLPDIWSDYDRHRDRLVSFLKQVRFGKSLRFFIDPFTERFGIHGDVQNLIPTSTAFRIEYAAWLSKKYRSPRDVGTSWGVVGRALASFDEAARLVPLWNAGRGAAVVYDDSSAKTYSINTTATTLWADFLEFRASSIGGYMDAAADVLKRLVADVPVVYTASGLQPIFRPTGSVGYDGLAVPSSGDPDALAAAAGRVFSLADGSSRNTWIIARFGPAGAAFAKKEELFLAINALRDPGAKGFFASSLAGTAVGTADLLVWLAEYSSVSAQDKQFVGYRPRVIYYPDTFARGSIRRLSSGVWWLPTLKPGMELALGSSFAGYVLGDPAGPGAEIYVWSLKDKRTMTLVADDPVTTVTAAGETAEVKPKKGRVQLSVGEEPIIVRGVRPDVFLPVEVAVGELDALEQLIVKAAQKRLDVGLYKRNLKYARDLLAKNQLGLCLDLVRANASDLRLTLKGLEATPVPASGTPPVGSWGAQ